MSTPEDHVDGTLLSECCSAPMMSGGMCSACHEHAEGYREDEPEQEVFSSDQDRAEQAWRAMYATPKQPLTP